MDPVNGDAEFSEVRDEESVETSASYWEEVNQEEIERERRYGELLFNSTKTSQSFGGISGKICQLMPVMQPALQVYCSERSSILPMNIFSLEPNITGSLLYFFG